MILMNNDVPDRSYLDSILKGTWDEHSGGYVNVFYTIYPEIEIIVRGYIQFDIVLNNIVEDSLGFFHPDSEGWYYMSNEEKNMHSAAFLTWFQESLKAVVNNHLKGVL